MPPSVRLVSLQCLILSLVLALAGAPASAFPDRPVRLVVPYAPGGGADHVARLVAGSVSTALRQPVIVENRTGGGGSIGAASVAQARPDGHVLLVDPSAHVANHVLIRGLGFDYERDFAPVAQLSVLPLLLVVAPADPARDLATWIGRARTRHVSLSYASAGNGTASHLAATLFLRGLGLGATHIPYRGGGPAVLDVAAGNVTFSLATVAAGLGMVEGGRLRALAVTSPVRLSGLPEVPTMAEVALPGFKASEWVGLYAPRATPAAVLDVLHDVVQRALSEAAVRARLTEAGALPGEPMPREAFARFVTEQRALTTRLLAEERITAD